MLIWLSDVSKLLLNCCFLLFCIYLHRVNDCVFGKHQFSSGFVILARRFLSAIVPSNPIG
jgi:hypothetical protein